MNESGTQLSEKNSIKQSNSFLRDYKGFLILFICIPLLMQAYVTRVSRIVESLSRLCGEFWSEKPFALALLESRHLEGQSVNENVFFFSLKKCWAFHSFNSMKINYHSIINKYPLFFQKHLFEMQFSQKNV